MHSFALRAAVSSYVIAEKNISTEGPCYVHLKGRQGGLIGFIKSLLGISAYFTVDVYDDYISTTQTNASGALTTVTPISKVANLGQGYMKPYLYLWIAVCALFYGIVRFVCDEPVSGTIQLLIALGCVIAFFLKKTLCLYWTSKGGYVDSAFMKRSLIENETMTQEEAADICKIILTLVRRANVKQKQEQPG